VRQMRIDGIKLSDGKEFVKAEAKLEEALKLSQQQKDAGLESSILNNLGYAIQNQARLEDAAKVYEQARKIAEERKDFQRAASCNFNLGRTYHDLRQYDDALGAFRRSTEQAEAIPREDWIAAGLLWQAITLGKINAVSTEAIKFFDRAEKIYEKIGDTRNAGRTLYYMADHMAYTQDFAAAARIGERAIPFLTQSGDKLGLLKCYEFLQDMYQKTKDPIKMDKYQKLAEETAKQLETQPNK
jgi:tetratricopeptide (TPR) repeat protein